MMGRRLLILAFVLLCLLLGTAANISVAWWIASRAEPFSIDRGFGFSHPGEAGWFVRRADDGAGSVRLVGNPATAWQSSGASEDKPSLVPLWSRFRTPPDENHPREQEVIEHGRGWPFISFSCAFIDTTAAQQRGWGRPRSFTIIDGIELESNLAPQMAWNRVMASAMDEPPAMPTRIFWPGMLANTILYSIAAALPLLVILFTRKGARAAQRWRRRRKCRCIGCGYDLRGHVPEVQSPGIACCPECGLAQPACG